MSCTDCSSTRHSSRDEWLARPAAVWDTCTRTMPACLESNACTHRCGLTSPSAYSESLRTAYHTQSVAKLTRTLGGHAVHVTRVSPAPGVRGRCTCRALRACAGRSGAAPLPHAAPCAAQPCAGTRGRAAVKRCRPWLLAGRPRLLHQAAGQRPPSPPVPDLRAALTRGPQLQRWPPRLPGETAAHRPGARCSRCLCQPRRGRLCSSHPERPPTAAAAARCGSR